LRRAPAITNGIIMTGSRAGKPSKGRQAGRRQGGVRGRLRRLPWFVWLSIVLAMAGVVVFVRIYPGGHAPPDHPGLPRAAIVDQLDKLQPNEAFIAQVTSELEEYGFQVHLHQGDDITVDFYRDLGTHGYKIIVLRVHSGLMVENGEVLRRTLLFTNEEYSTRLYSIHQARGRLASGSAGEEDPMMFGITSEFVSSNWGMQGQLEDTVIIMMGCSGIYLTDLAEAFVSRGASAYLAWHGSVYLHYVDDATPYLIEQLCSERATIGEAVDRTMARFGPDPGHKAELRYYPPGVSHKTLEHLLQEILNDEDGMTSDTEWNGSGG